MRKLHKYKPRYELQNIVTLKVLPTSCISYNSEEKSKKFPNSKMKLKYDFPCANSIIKCIEDLRNHRFLKIFLSIYLGKFTHSFQSFTKCFSYIIV